MMVSISLILALKRQEELEFQTSVGYIARPCLKNWRELGWGKNEQRKARMSANTIKKTYLSKHKKLHVWC